SPGDVGVPSGRRSVTVTPGIGRPTEARSSGRPPRARNKEELLDLLADAVADVPDLPLYDGDDWRAGLSEIMRALRRHLLAYRDSARLLSGRFAAGRGQLRMVEAVLGALRGGGLSDRDTAYALYLLTTF